MRFRSASKSSSCSTPWMTPNTHHVTWSWMRVSWPGPQTRATIENDPSGSTCRGVAAVAVRRAAALVVGQHVRAGEVPAQLVGHEPRGLRPVAMAVHGGADAGDERAQVGGGRDRGRGHARKLAAGRLIRPMPTFKLAHRWG